MKKTTFRFLSSIPLVGPIAKTICDPMLASTPAMMDGLPKQVIAYQKAHPDVFITKRLLKAIMAEKVK